MKKSNILIVAILVVASIIFLWLWYALQFNLVDDPLDLVITIVWWVVIVGVCVAIYLVEKRRQQSARTAFLADGVIYNSEVGLVRLSEKDARNYVSKLKDILSNLQYKTSMENIPSDDQVRFSCIVRSQKFSQDGNVWEGEVVRLTEPKGEYHFDNASELTTLLSGKHVA